MSNRLTILKNSLQKKQEVLDAKFSNHFKDVKSANGQPLNDKQNGQATFNRWEKQNDSIRKQLSEVEKTKNAIEREEGKICETDFWYSKMPKVLTDLIDSGTLVQWRKHPRICFVVGVDKARICFDDKTGVISHKYVKVLTDQAQFAIFRDVFNGINAKQKKGE